MKESFHKVKNFAFLTLRECKFQFTKWTEEKHSKVKMKKWWLFIMRKWRKSYFLREENRSWIA